jgi:hypothetical protein
MVVRLLEQLLYWYNPSLINEGAMKETTQNNTINNEYANYKREAQLPCTIMMISWTTTTKK